MFTGRRLWWKFTFLIVGLLTLLFFVDFGTLSLNTKNMGRIIKSISSQNTIESKYKLFSKCECRRNETVMLSKKSLNKRSNKNQSNEYKISNENSDLYEVTSTLNSFNNYIVKEQELDELICGVYETLRRGRHQKVIGYSLYGKEKFYSGYLESM